MYPVEELSRIGETKIFSFCTREIKQSKDHVLHKHIPKKRNGPMYIYLCLSKSNTWSLLITNPEGITAGGAISVFVILLMTFSTSSRANLWVRSSAFSPCSTRFFHTIPETGWMGGLTGACTSLNWAILASTASWTLRSKSACCAKTAACLVLEFSLSV